jgi:hypothetical protein
MRRWLLACLLLFPLLAGARCGGDGRTPEIVELSYDGQAPDSELVLMFTASFEDGDGDLGEGYFETFINGQPSGLGPLELRQLFLANGIALDAPRGDLEFVLELAFASPPEGATTFELGVRPVDASGNAGSTATQNLRVTAN